MDTSDSSKKQERRRILLWDGPKNIPVSMTPMMTLSPIFARWRRFEDADGEDERPRKSQLLVVRILYKGLGKTRATIGIPVLPFGVHDNMIIVS